MRDEVRQSVWTLGVVIYTMVLALVTGATWVIASIGSYIFWDLSLMSNQGNQTWRTPGWVPFIGVGCALVVLGCGIGIGFWLFRRGEFLR